jgi:hypothetical protein
MAAAALGNAGTPATYSLHADDVVSTGWFTALQNSNSTNTTSWLTFAQLEKMNYPQINSSQVLQQVATKYGYSSIDQMIPGLKMFWDDVSEAGGAGFPAHHPSTLV